MGGCPNADSKGQSGCPIKPASLRTCVSRAKGGAFGNSDEALGGVSDRVLEALHQFIPAEPGVFDAFGLEGLVDPLDAAARGADPELAEPSAVVVPEVVVRVAADAYGDL